MLTQLQRRLGYTFTQEELLRTAVTHASWGADNNERLEFLGDAVLGLCMSQILYRHASGFSEGEMSRIRSALVKADTLSELAQQLSLGDYLRLGNSERANTKRLNILADALEAIIGAIYLDSGLEACMAFIERLYQGRLDSASFSSCITKDPKTALQELAQMRGLLPVYTVLSVCGPGHAQEFLVRCTLEGLSTEGKGRSQREASRVAAQAMYPQYQAFIAQHSKKRKA